MAGPTDVLTDMPVVILCGGEGTRFYEETRDRPKPLADVGGRPILHHIMQIYAAHGFHRFVLCLGYKGVMIKEFFLNYQTHRRDFALRLGDGVPRFLDEPSPYDWDISFVETGAQAMTGARVSRIRHLVDTEHFMLTYGDGVADIDIGRLAAFHLAHGGIGTVTGVQSNSQFGELSIEQDHVRAFAEKPKITSVINGGFFVFRRAFFEYLEDAEGCVLEQGPLTRLCQDGQLRVYRHHGFWQCMDTFKDYRRLNELCASGMPPWASSGSRA